MNKIARHIILTVVMVALLASTMLCPTNATAAGVSIDAGLTPAFQRWILRSQVRYMERTNDPSMANKEMKMFMFPVVIAYGLRPDVTIMVKQVVKSNEMTMMGETSTTNGLADLFVMGKYRLIRKNARNYTLGVAPTLGLEIPTGDDALTSNSYDLTGGCFFSGRFGNWGADLNIKYAWNGMALIRGTKLDPSDEFTIAGAVAYRYGLGSNGNIAISPVLESTYIRASAEEDDGVRLANTGESVLYLSPGMKLTIGSFILESLVRVPVWQDQNGMQPELGSMLLVGFRLMN